MRHKRQVIKYVKLLTSQPRKRSFCPSSQICPFSEESGSPGDYLTCGGCKRKYVLADLTKFVQHKVLDCNKENSDITAQDDNEDMAEYDKCKSLRSPRVSGSGQTDEDEISRSYIKAETEEKKPIVKDNGANTIKSGTLKTC